MTATLVRTEQELRGMLPFKYDPKMSVEKKMNHDTMNALWCKEQFDDLLSVPRTDQIAAAASIYGLLSKDLFAAARAAKAALDTKPHVQSEPEPAEPSRPNDGDKIIEARRGGSSPPKPATPRYRYAWQNNADGTGDFRTIADDGDSSNKTREPFEPFFNSARETRLPQLSDTAKFASPDAFGELERLKIHSRQTSSIEFHSPSPNNETTITPQRQRQNSLLVTTPSPQHEPASPATDPDWNEYVLSGPSSPVRSSPKQAISSSWDISSLDDAAFNIGDSLNFTDGTTVSLARSEAKPMLYSGAATLKQGESSDGWQTALHGKWYRKDIVTGDHLFQPVSKSQAKGLNRYAFDTTKPWPTYRMTGEDGKLQWVEEELEPYLVWEPISKQRKLSLEHAFMTYHPRLEKDIWQFKQWAEDHALTIVCVECQKHKAACDHSWPCKPCQKHKRDCKFTWAYDGDSDRQDTACPYGANCHNVHKRTERLFALRDQVLRNPLPNVFSKSSRAGVGLCSRNHEVSRGNEARASLTTGARHGHPQSTTAVRNTPPGITPVQPVVQRQRQQIARAELTDLD